MWHDLCLIARLRLRQFSRSAHYWLRVLGYEPASRARSERLYLIYLLLFGLGWTAAMALIALNSAVELGRALPPAAFTGLPVLLPWLVLAGQTLALIQALRSHPLKLTYPDMAYLAGSPLSRGALALAAWVSSTARALAIALPASALIAVALAAGMAQDALEPRAASAIALALPLLALTLALAWGLGLARAASPALHGRRLLWLAPFALLPLAGWLPGVLLWPGRALVLALTGTAPAAQAPALLWLALLPCLALIAALGERVHMAGAIHESQTYARIQALGMGTWLAPDVVRSIRRQAALAARRPFLRLPRAGGPWALVARTGLALARAPGDLLSLLLWGGLIANASAWLVSGSAYPPQWAAWLVLVMFAPPGALAEALHADTGNPFLRQFLPQSNLRLLAADLALPSLALTLIALALWLLARPAPGAAALGALAVVSLAALIVLCRAVSLLPTSLGRPLPYAPTTAISLGAVILISTEAQAPLAAVVVALLLAAGLAALAAGSRRPN